MTFQFSFKKNQQFYKIRFNKNKEKMKPLKDRYSTPAEKENYVQNMFSEIDEHYDLMNRVMSLGMDMRWRRKAIRVAEFDDKGILLDVAAGTGDMSLAAKKMLPNVKIMGVDFCRPFLDIAREKFSHNNNHASVNLIQGNGLKLPFANNTFHGVFNGFLLRNIADVKELYTELYRVTRPGGKVVSLEMMKQTNLLQKSIFSVHQKRIVPFMGRIISLHPEAYEYLPLSIENFYTADELSKVITSVGWKNVFHKKIMFGFLAVHVGIK